VPPSTPGWVAAPKSAWDAIHVNRIRLSSLQTQTSVSFSEGLLDMSFVVGVRVLCISCERKGKHTHTHTYINVSSLVAYTSTIRVKWTYLLVVTRKMSGRLVLPLQRGELLLVYVSYAYEVTDATLYMLVALMVTWKNPKTSAAWSFHLRAESSSLYTFHMHTKSQKSQTLHCIC